MESLGKSLHLPPQSKIEWMENKTDNESKEEGKGKKEGKNDKEGGDEEEVNKEKEDNRSHDKDKGKQQQEVGSVVVNMELENNVNMYFMRPDSTPLPNRLMSQPITSTLLL
ncbi:hypothetical protein HD554DRAFT_2038929 [Boletus coccyginus]|nr:hypothetical protein HD554DRAFT_2038929 [Boletus coccyginus]